MLQFEEAFIQRLEKIEEAIGKGNFEKSKDLVVDLISASYLLENPYSLLIAEYLYSVFRDLSSSEFPPLIRRRRVGIRPHSWEVSGETKEELTDDLYQLKLSFDSLKKTIELLFTEKTKESKAKLLDKMVEFRMQASKLAEKWG